MRRYFFASVVLVGLALGATESARAQEQSITTVPATPEEAAATVEPAGGTWTGLPLFSYSPETRFAFGGFGVHSFRLGGAPSTARASYLAVAAMYTTRNQALVDFFPVLWFGPPLSEAERTEALRDIAQRALSDSDRMRQFERFSLSGQFSYRRMPDSFFGLGNNTRASDVEAYTLHSFWDSLDFRVRVRGPLFVGLRQEFQYQEILDTRADGMLAQGVTGAEGGIRSGLGLTLVWDDRDNTQSPRSGAFDQLSLVTFQHGLGSRWAYTRLTLDLRQYVQLAPRHVLAFQLYGDFNFGEVPFNQLAQLGGTSRLRGFYEGRYRDDGYVMAQAEYRVMPIVWRLGAVFFAAVGEVFDRLKDFRPDALHWAVGAGIRAALDPAERIYVRIDVGCGPEGCAPYVNVLEAF